MLELAIHVYRYVEVYAVVLLWIVTPLGFFACYLFFHTHYRMFAPSHNVAGVKKERPIDGDA